MKRSPKLFLADIFESIGLIEKYTRGLTYEKFLKNNSIQDAVIRRLEIIGEAAKNIPSNIKEKNPGVPWNEMSGLRNILTHEYFGIVMKRIWDTTLKDLPKLKKQIAKILREIE